MKAYAVLKQLAPGAMAGHRFPAGMRHIARGVDVNWYQVAVVAVATFAISMELMFPPFRVAIGDSLDIYAGHTYVPQSMPGAVQVDFVWLAVELLAIIAAAVAGWRIGTPAGDRRKSARDPA